MLRATKAVARMYQLTIDGQAEEVTPKKRPRDNEEEREQALLFARRKEYLEKYPDLRYLFATLNGVYIPRPYLSRVVASGLVAGVLDVWLPVARRNEDGTLCPGVIMDMKKPKKGRPSSDQLRWAEQLTACGFRVFFPTSALEAWWILCCYLGISGPDHIAADLERQSELGRIRAS